MVINWLFIPHYVRKTKEGNYFRKKLLELMSIAQYCFTLLSNSKQYSN